MYGNIKEILETVLKQMWRNFKKATEKCKGNNGRNF